MKDEWTILTEDESPDDYHWSARKMPYREDVWQLRLMYQDGGEWLYASGVRNSDVTLTTSEIQALAKLAGR